MNWMFRGEIVVTIQNSIQFILTVMSGGHSVASFVICLDLDLSKMTVNDPKSCWAYYPK